MAISIVNAINVSAFRDSTVQVHVQVDEQGIRMVFLAADDYFESGGVCYSGIHLTRDDLERILEALRTASETHNTEQRAEAVERMCQNCDMTLGDCYHARHVKGKVACCPECDHRLSHEVLPALPLGEDHTHTTRALFDALESVKGARREPLGKAGLE